MGWGFGRLGSLTRDDLRLAVGAYVSLLTTDVALRVLGYRRLLERIERAPAAATLSPRRLRRARRYAGWLDVAARRHFVPARCLHRSLALHAWLRAKGLPSELKIGVRKESGELRAHAWVVLGEHVVNDRQEAVAAFAPLAGSSAGVSAPALRLLEKAQ